MRAIFLFNFTFLFSFKTPDVWDFDKTIKLEFLLVTLIETIFSSTISFFMLAKVKRKTMNLHLGKLSLASFSMFIFFFFDCLTHSVC